MFQARIIAAAFDAPSLPPLASQSQAYCGCFFMQLDLWERFIIVHLGALILVHQGHGHGYQKGSIRQQQRDLENNTSKISEV